MCFFFVVFLNLKKPSSFYWEFNDSERVEQITFCFYTQYKNAQIHLSYLQAGRYT